LALLTSAWTSRAEDHPVWDPGLEQAAYGVLGGGTPPSTIDELRALVEPYLTMSDAELQARISTERGGAADGAGRYERAQATYDLALLYHLTGELDYAHRAAVLLARYAQVFPSWSYEVCPGQTANGNTCGVWTDWYHDDFDVSMLLALAFDLLAPDDRLEGQEAAIRTLLGQIVARDLEYRMYTFNWAFYRPVGLVVFGRVLDDPELVHLGYWFYAKHVHEYYTQDGFMNEGTYSYHLQMTRRFTSERQAFYLDGYSDPPGYAHTPFDTRWDPVRIDDFDTAATYGLAWQRMQWSLGQTSLPDGWFPVLNDTKHYDVPHGEPPDQSVLLGGIGHAVLAAGQGTEQTQARLDFTHTVGHRHFDALHLIYFADGRETIGGTAYRYPDGAWNRSTLSHNLVAIDEADQKGAYYVDWTMSPYVPGVGRIDDGLADRQPWNQETENLHNDVLLWEPGYGSFDAVQVVEVDGTDAYRDHADRYRRLLALVRIEQDEYYLADIFRVRGGSQHDWLLHGGHSPNALTIAAATTPTTGSLGLIDFVAELVTDEGWEASFDHEGTIGRVLMTGAAGTRVIAGTGPRYEYGGQQDHLVVRRAANAGDEQVFAAVHEVHQGDPRVAGVARLSFAADDGAAVGLRIELGSGVTDYLIYSTEEDVLHEVAGLDLSARGRFVHLRVDGGEVRWALLVHGRELLFGDVELTAGTSDFTHRGAITAVERREAGAAEDAFVVDQALPEGQALVGKTLLATAGNGWTWPYRIERIDGSRVITTDEPGFEVDGAGMDRMYFPLQEHLGLERIAGPVRFVVPGTALRDIDGSIRTTLDEGAGGSGGAAGTGGAAGGISVTSPAADGSSDGCDCATAGARDARSSERAALVWLLIGLAACFQRRRRRPTRRHVLE
jgi:MYXO-CTERM domain-containing protein